MYTRKRSGKDTRLRDDPGPRGAHTSVANKRHEEDRPGEYALASGRGAGPRPAPPTGREERVGVLAQVCAEDLISAFVLLFLAESLPEERRSRASLLRLDPFSGILGTLRLGG